MYSEIYYKCPVCGEDKMHPNQTKMVNARTESHKSSCLDCYYLWCFLKRIIYPMNDRELEIFEKNGYSAADLRKISNKATVQDIVETAEKLGLLTVDRSRIKYVYYLNRAELKTRGLDTPNNPITDYFNSEQRAIASVSEIRPLQQIKTPEKTFTTLIETKPKQVPYILETLNRLGLHDFNIKGRNNDVIVEINEREVVTKVFDFVCDQLIHKND